MTASTAGCSFSATTTCSGWAVHPSHGSSECLRPVSRPMGSPRIAPRRCCRTLGLWPADLTELTVEPNRHYRSDVAIVHRSVDDPHIDAETIDGIPVTSVRADAARPRLGGFPRSTREVPRASPLPPGHQPRGALEVHRRGRSPRPARSAAAPRGARAAGTRASDRERPRDRDASATATARACPNQCVSTRSSWPHAVSASTSRIQT